MYPRPGEIGRTRTERDARGSIEVPFDALYGARTERDRRNFPISGVSIGQLPDLIHALALIKKAAARANARLGHLSKEKATVIERVCEELISGQHRQHFPVDVFQGGAGTSTNTNMNEVIANRGLELMGRPCGDYARLHPDDDVNRSQSGNDLYLAAVRMALMSSMLGLMKAFSALAAGFEDKEETRAYGVTVREDVERLQAAVDLLSEVSLGGAARRAGVTTPEGFRDEILRELEHFSSLKLKPAADLIEADWDAGVFVHLSGVLKRVATKLSKIVNDLGLLSSGARSAVQAGSSAMPAREKPVIAEIVNQVVLQVIGTDVTISLAAEAGQLQPNAFEPVMAFGLLQSVMLLRNATLALRSRCLEGIEADASRGLENFEHRQLRGAGS